MWQKGPLPPNTWDWGGVVPTDLQSTGFYFADFCGDHVKVVCPGNPNDGQVIKAEDVAWFNNCLDLPPCCPKGTRQ